MSKALKKKDSSNDALNLQKRITKIIDRVDNLFEGVLDTSWANRIYDKIKKSEYFNIVNVNAINLTQPLTENSGMRLIDLDTLFDDIVCDIRLVHKDDLSKLLPKIHHELEFERNRQNKEEILWKASQRKEFFESRNSLPTLQGKWRKEPYPLREYEYIEDYVVTTTISDVEAEVLRSQMYTSKADGFFGQAYNYDDQGLTEEWMLSFSEVKKDDSGIESLYVASEEEVIRTQIETLMEVLLSSVQDNVLTMNGILNKDELQLGKGLREQPVWGIDSRTRRLIELVIEDHLPALCDPIAVKWFIEKSLLPAINAQDPKSAWNMSLALQHIINSESSKKIEREYAETVLCAVQQYDRDTFRIHPKGTGVICDVKDGIPPHVVVTQYLGELYPPSRWCERMDVVEQAQESFGLKPSLPDFYNILLERPRQDKGGYALLFVDASQKASLGSSCSHSCDANCTSSVVARNGKLTIVLTTNRQVSYGEELTFDYCSTTSSEVEWRSAICLCGMSYCRGSFLRFVTQDDLQQVMTSNCGPLCRFASLLRACCGKPVKKVEENVLVNHGMGSAALGPSPPVWIQKFVYDHLLFMEFERKALPCALMRKSDKYIYSFSGADNEARSVLEQRLQSLVCCVSLINGVLKKLSDKAGDCGPQPGTPLRVIPPEAAIKTIWSHVAQIPKLIKKHIPSGTLNSFVAKGTGKSPAKSPARSPLRSPGKNESPLLDQLRRILASVPTGMGRLKSSLLDLRNVLLPYTSLSNNFARLDQLCDLLVLWAYTQNYTVITEFDEVLSEPIAVVARELGTNIPRQKLTPSSVSKSNETKAIISKANDSRQKKSATAVPVASIITEEDEISQDLNMTTEESSSSSSDNPSVNSEPLPESHVEVSTELEDRGQTTGAGDELPLVESATAHAEMELQMCDAGEDHPPADSTPSTGSTRKLSRESVSRSSKSKQQQRESLARAKGGAEETGDIVPPSEVVYTGSKVYDKLFVFRQLMGWYCAGSDEKPVLPDLFGCIRLPLPQQCFGTSEKPYTTDVRRKLLEILDGDLQQTKPWPDAVKTSFRPIESDNRLELLGSPMLDVYLGTPNAMEGVLDELVGKSRKKKERLEDDDDQYDKKLPPETPTEWVQCESCKAWRRVAWNVDLDSLPQNWTCANNFWFPEKANCSLPEDDYDPDTSFDLTGHQILEGVVSLDYYPMGQLMDVFCIKNQVFYEAKVVKIKQPAGPGDCGKLLFHFLGWSSKYDEWIEPGSVRLAPHSTHTKPTYKGHVPNGKSDPREQEKYQGMNKLTRIGRKICNASQKKNSSGKSDSAAVSVKRKSIGDSNGSASLESANSKKKTSTKGGSSSNKKRRLSADELNAVAKAEEKAAVAVVMEEDLGALMESLDTESREVLVNNYDFITGADQPVVQLKSKTKQSPAEEKLSSPPEKRKRVTSSRYSRDDYVYE